MGAQTQTQLKDHFHNDQCNQENQICLEDVFFGH